MPDVKVLHVSVNSLQDFMTCRRLYWYKRIKKYEKIQYNLPFVVGRVVHVGLAALLQKSIDPKTGKSNAIALMKVEFRKEKAVAIKQFRLDEKELEKLTMQEYITEGMLRAYAYKYQKMIQDMQYLGGEVEGALEFSEHVTFVIKMDNIVRIRMEKVLHELKTSKTITPDYIQRIRTDIQTAIYFHFHNIIFEDEPIQKVMYDVIRKPSIKQKKTETALEFVERLKSWYNKPDDSSSAFHIERFDTPGITKDDVINTVDKVTQEMLKTKTKEDYYQDFDKCSSYYGGKCSYYDLCHNGGEIPSNLVQFTIRKSYHVSKENKRVEDNVGI